MRDYLTSLAARSLEPAPAIQPRLASLFEPLGLVGPVFSRTGRVAHRFETIATADGAAPEVLTQSRADPDSAERAILPMPASSLKIANQSADWASRDAPPPVSDQQRKPVATTVHLAEPESLSTRETEDIESRDQIVSRSRPPEEGPAKVVVPVIDVAVSGENSHRDEPRPPEKVWETTGKEIAVALVANANETRQPRESIGPENKLAKRRDSESSNEIRAENKSSPITPGIQNDQRQLSAQSLVVPRATIESIRTDRGARSPIPVPKTEVPRDATSARPIADIKPHRNTRARPAAAVVDGPIRPETQPSINVTIGRVEIRALLPTTSRPSRKDSETPKLMGLDDYLRQRAQGGAR